MNDYQLTLNFNNLNDLLVSVKAIAAVVGEKASATVKVGAEVVDLSAEKAERKAKKAKATNGEAADVRETAREINREHREAYEMEGAQKVILDQALGICRGLLESGNADAKAGLKALRDELEVKKLSDVPLEAAAGFLTKAQALQAKHGE